MFTSNNTTIQFGYQFKRVAEVALVDFLFILNKRGEAISWRMLMGVKSRLNPERFLQLKNYLKNEGILDIFK